MRTRENLIRLLLLTLLFQSCQQESPLFVLKSEVVAPFLNQLDYTEEFNPYTYRNFYNGGGVALGDINNDGLVDIYYTGNLVDNKMYLNKGNWIFEDVTQQTGLACANVWSSGANFVDINGDGLLDLYVCKAGKPEGTNRHNELFINKGNLQFEEQAAQYGLDITGLSIQSAFFDYDQDGDLDCYLLNNSLKSVGGFDLVKDRRNIPSKDGNKFFENQNGTFHDATQQAGIYSSAIGFGLGITLSDFNVDGWTDIYISNDFFEKDYLYINNQDKTFTEQGEDYFECFPLGSMGADVADIDNDLLPDLMITEMLPHSIERKKTKAIYESWNKYVVAQSSGYANQLPRNMLQRNMGAAGFLELGRKAGVEATDWSWSSLMQDFDNDGLKDIVIANGIYKDLLDRDYLAFMANESVVKQNIESKDAITKLIDAMPSQALPNYAFKNIGEFNFENQSTEWGLGLESFSNGCAYGDLDNDGDLDLIFNNVNMPSFVFENRTERLENNFIKILLEGNAVNAKAIGAKVIIYACEQTFMSEQFPSRGFQSSVSNHQLLGLGKCPSIDSLQVIWPNGLSTIQTNVSINTTLTIQQTAQAAKPTRFASIKKENLLNSKDTIAVVHQQPRFNQFNRERLLMKMNATEGPAIAVADVNQDQELDIFIGGGKGQASTLLVSNKNGESRSVLLEGSLRSEVTEAIFFDCDNDGDQDLYVAHGGTAFSPYAIELHDVLYVNDGTGNLQPKKGAIQFPKPVTTGAVAIADYDQDGLLDIFVGDRNSNTTYGLPGNGYLFKNKGQQVFQLINMPSLEQLGIITDAKWVFVNDDDLPDLVVVGEWMPISVFINTGTGFERQALGLEKTNGLWNTILVSDFNKDGKEDIFVGNMGNNNALSTKHQLYINDFDENGSLEQILTEEVDGQIRLSHDMDELMSQLPPLKRKVIYYKEYSKSSIQDLFDPAKLRSSKVLHIDLLESQLFLNDNGQFKPQDLPEEIQYSCIHAAISYDVDKDGLEELIVGGNHYLTKPQYGRDDASKGWIVYIDKVNDTIQFNQLSPLNVQGEIRDIEALNANQLLIGVINQAIKKISF